MRRSDKMNIHAQFTNFWYQFHRYAHPSWMAMHSIPQLSSESSILRWNLAYSDVCEQLGVDSDLPIKREYIDMDFIYRFLEAPSRYLKLAGACLSESPKKDFLEASTMQECDLNFAIQTSRTLSLGQRFTCLSEAPPTLYEVGVLLLHAYIMTIDEILWQRIKLSIDAEIEKDLENPDGETNLHHGVLKRLWKTIDLYIIFSKEGVDEHIAA